MLPILIIVLFAMSSLLPKEQKLREVTRSYPLQVKGAIPYWDQERAVSSFEENIEKINTISLFWYHIGADSDILKYDDAEEDESIIDHAHDKDVKVLAVITNLSDYTGAEWDSDRVREIITDDEKRANHIEDIVELVEDKNFDGVNIDYEELDEDLEDEFSLFIEELSEKMDAKDKIVGVALHPKSGEDLPQEDNGSRAQDWKELARYADELYLMTYGEHWDNSAAGPIASLGWVEKKLIYLQSLGVPLEKFYLGIPLYGEDWNKDKEELGMGLTYTDVQNILDEYDPDVKWDDKQKSPYFFYEKEGDTHEVWFEDARSVGEKIKLANKAGLGGVTFWRLGGEDSDIWKIL